MKLKDIQKLNQERFNTLSALDRKKLKSRGYNNQGEAGILKSYNLLHQHFYPYASRPSQETIHPYNRGLYVI